MSDPLDFAVVTALVLAAMLAFGPNIRASLRPHTRIMRSFGGGVGLAYVFLQLLPEIDNAHAWLGEHVHIVTLASFLLFFALETWLVLRFRSGLASPGDEAHHEEAPLAVFWLHVGIMFFYISMVVFTLPHDVAEDLLFATVSGAAIGIHLVYKDYLLRAHVRDDYATRGRLLLVSAPLLGWVAHRLVEPSELALDLLIAVMAGVLLQSVFRDELPRPGMASMGWIVVGVATFAALALIY